MSTTYERFGKYMLLEKLATGGMAEVFLARGSGAGGIGKFFAIKRILPQYADSPEFIDMFKDEAKIAINLNHSNIVSIHEFGVEKGIFYLVMDYVEGRNLRQILNKMKKSSLQFSMDQIVYIIKEAASGLDHAHRCLDGTTGKPLNITHRDMSPQNLMVSFEGETKIVDFGIAKAESQLETTRAGTLKGKFGYMSPEQAEGQPVDLRTDIFSLGIVTWELLANDRLFVANNEINTLRKIRDCQIPSLRKINPNIHTELERIVQKALARDRNLRYQTAAALHRDLNRFLNRQYPDFSPQDFSVFIKSVFSDEIMSLRKRLVEYSKLNVGAGFARSSGDKTFDDRTSLLNTDTNSLVVSDSGAPSDSVASHASTQPQAENNLPAESDVTIGRPHENDSMPSIKPALSPAEEHEDSIFTASLAANTLELSSGDSSPQSLPPPAVTQNQNGVLDSNALDAEMKRQNRRRVIEQTQGGVETEEVTSPSFTRTRTFDTRTARPSKSTPANVNGSSMRVATVIVFSLLCVSVYAYMVKYFNPIMKDVIAMTDPYIHPFHQALGVEPQSTSFASHNGDGKGGVDPMPAPQPTLAPPAAHTQSVVHADPTPAANVGATPAPSDTDAEGSAVVVISNPSGAEIFINDKATGMVTPSRVELPPGKFSITLQKNGYVPKRFTDQTKETISHRLMVALVKMNVAYVDIEVFPPQEAAIYVNGRKLTPQRSGFRQLPIPANTSVKIRAETKTGYDEVNLTLPVDRRQTVQLRPRKAFRLPTASPSDADE